MRKPVVPVALALVLLLAGCTPPDPVVTPVPEPSSTPLFATDADALKAATDAYAAYESALDAAFKTYDSSTLGSVAAGKALAAAISSVNEYRRDGKSQTGTSSIDTVSAVDLSPLLDARKRTQDAQIYACLDVSGVDVIDSSGTSVVAKDAVRRYPEIVTLRWDESTNVIKVRQDDVWRGRNFCG